MRSSPLRPIHEGRATPADSGRVDLSTRKTPGIHVPASEIEKLKSIARDVLWGAGIDYSPNKIARLCLTFVNQVERNGFSFAHFLVNTVQLDAEQRRAVLANPDLQRVIAYADPTGETAVANVIRERRHVGSPGGRS